MNISLTYFILHKKLHYYTRVCICNVYIQQQVQVLVWSVCYQQELHAKYGNIDAEAVIEMVGRVKTGNLQAVVYDLLNMRLYVANAKGANETGPGDAFDRQFVTIQIG